MNLVKDLGKMFKPHHVISTLGFLIILYVLYEYCNHKNLSLSGFTEGGSAQGSAPGSAQGSASGSALASSPKQSQEQLQEQGHSLPPQIASSNCSQQPVLTPSELLPKQSDSSWSALQLPVNVNLLDAGPLKSINTVGSSLRNANLQVRSEPPNPQTKVSPWLNSTIEPDLMRAPFEIGCGCPGS